MVVEPLEARRLMSASPSVDPNFGPLLADVPGGNEEGLAVLADPDGRIVVGGTWTAETLPPLDRRVQLSRYHASGRLDRRFGQEGIALVSPRGMDDLHYLRRQDDGRMLVLGSRRDDLGSDARFRVILARLTVSGKIDRGFGLSGSVPVGTPGRSDFRGAISQATADGKVVVAVAYSAGVDDSLIQLQRFDLATGQPDQTFGRDGLVRTRLDFSAPTSAQRYALLTVRAVHVRGDGTIDVAFDFRIADTNPSGSGVAHFSKSGRLDVMYGSDGVYRTPADHVGVDNFLFEPSGNVAMVTTGSGYGHDEDDAYFRRLTPQGRPDPSLGSDGIRKLPDFGDILTDVERTGDGGFLAIGFRQRQALWRFNRNFSIDTGFGTSGAFVLSPDEDMNLRDMTLPGDGSAIAVGSTHTDDVPLTTRSVGIRVHGV